MKFVLLQCPHSDRKRTHHRSANQRSARRVRISVAIVPLLLRHPLRRRRGHSLLRIRVRWNTRARRAVTVLMHVVIDAADIGFGHLDARIIDLRANRQTGEHRRNIGEG